MHAFVVSYIFNLWNIVTKLFSVYATHDIHENVPSQVILN